VYLISELFGKKWQAYTLVNLILKKISKIGGTRCQILRLKCTKIDFGWGSAPGPAGGAYSAPPNLLAVFKGPTSKGKYGEGEERMEREVEGKGREGRTTLSQIPGYAIEHVHTS